VRCFHAGDLTRRHMTYSPQTKVSFQCPACRKQFTAPSTVAGRQVRCSGCGGSVTIPRSGSATQGAAVHRPPVATPSSNAPSGALPAAFSQHVPPPQPRAASDTTRTGRSFKMFGTAGLIIFGIVIVGGLARSFRPESQRDAERSGRSERPERSFWSSRKTKTVRLPVGTATITDDVAGTSHVRVACNNGLVIDADWKRNPSSSFGYDIYEPTVNQNYNRLAVMMTARGVIAAYLRGEYD